MYCSRYIALIYNTIHTWTKWYCWKKKQNKTLVKVTQSIFHSPNNPFILGRSYLYIMLYSKLNSHICYQNTTPYEVWRHHKLTLAHLHVFKCPCYVQVPLEIWKKWDNKSKKCILIGYRNQVVIKDYKLYDQHAHITIFSQNVILEEEVIFLDQQPTYSNVPSNFLNYI